MSLLFFIEFFLWFIYIRFFVFCTTLTHLKIKKKKYIYIYIYIGYVVRKIRQQLEFNFKSN